MKQMKIKWRKVMAMKMMKRKTDRDRGMICGVNENSVNERQSDEWIEIFYSRLVIKLKKYYLSIDRNGKKKKYTRKNNV